MFPEHLELSYDLQTPRLGSRDEVAAVPAAFENR